MKKYWIIFLALCFSVFTNAATLRFPDTVELMAVNGQKMKVDGHLVELHKGNNELVFRYVEVLKHGTKKKKYQSAPLISVINVFQDRILTLSHRVFNTYAMAEVAFRKDNVNWKLSYSNGDVKALTPDVLPGNEGLFPYANIEKLIEKYNLSHNINISPTTLSQVSRPEKININTNSDEFIKKIKAWYLNASDIEKKALLKWMIEQN
ncbi:DUF2057 family protein [Vibrio salinus]|uniref:DUF2057 family protein n=1 Tax=Vibrio salinus TaxID=2899784 RepID=UPI001E2E1F6D|nr:DUF2057 family protein [Vibrio salinus]MCE0493293.1 DUF2057 domain-containing protein [Vibrio salinus]